MDWRVHAYKRLRSEKSFRGKPRPETKSSKCRVLYLFEDTAGTEGSEIQKMEDKELVEWLQGLEKTESQDTEAQKIEPEEIELQSHRDGFRLLLCRRPEAADSRANFFNIPFGEKISKDASGQGDSSAQDSEHADVHCLPSSWLPPWHRHYAQDPPAQDAHKKYNIENVLKRFPVHVHMGQVIKRDTPYLSVVDMPKSTKDPRRIVYTAIFETGLEGFKENLVFTSTYFPSNRTSFGIILGCTEQDVRKATALIADCGSSRNHQLLLPAVFLELQRQRLKGIRTRHTQDAIELQDSFEELRDFKNGRKPFQFRYQPLTVYECASRLSKLCTDSNVMAEDLRIASRQLNILKRHTEKLAEIQDKELKKPKKGKESPGAEPSKSSESSSDEPPTDKQMRSALDNTRCFLDLFNEIAEDVELVSGAATVNAKAATVTADEMDRASAKQDARSSMGLAFVAMAYLPITALATIFALPVFDFKAQWRDMYNQPANWSEFSSNDGPDSGSPSESPPPVMSIYFTYWISASLVLTLLTIEGWWIFSSDVDEWRWDRFWSLSQLAWAVARLNGKWTGFVKSYRNRKKQKNDVSMV